MVHRCELLVMHGHFYIGDGERWDDPVEFESADNQDMLFAHGYGIRCLTGGTDFYVLVSITIADEEPNFLKSAHGNSEPSTGIEQGQVDLKIHSGELTVANTIGHQECEIELPTGLWNVHVTVFGRTQNTVQRNSETEIYRGGENWEFTLWPKAPNETESSPTALPNAEEIAITDPRIWFDVDTFELPDSNTGR